MRNILPDVRRIVRKVWLLSQIILLLFVSRAGIVMGQEETSSLTTVTTQDGYVFDIRAASHWEESQPIYCQVTKDGELILPLKQIDISYGEVEAFEFMIFEGTQGVAVLTKTLEFPLVLATYDVNTRTVCLNFLSDTPECEEFSIRFFWEQGELRGRLYAKGAERIVTRLKTTSGVVFYITTTYGFVEGARPIHCQGIKQKELIFPSKLIMFTGITAPYPDFTLFEGDDNLIALIEQSSPYDVLALYDLKHRISWTASYSGPRTAREEYDKIGKELLERLNKGRSAPLFR